MIKIEIEATSAEEARNEMSVLIGVTATTVQSAAPQEQIAPNREELKAPEPERPKTRQRAEKAPAPTVEAPAVAETPAPVQTDPLVSSDPLSTPAPQADPLNTPAPAQSDPLATAPAAKTEVALQDVRDKIGTLGDKRQQVKDLIATYKKADGTACDRPGDLQEKDYASVLADLDYI